jgi:probable HAF family extracellular repeat protein
MWREQNSELGVAVTRSQGVPSLSVAAQRGCRGVSGRYSRLAGACAYVREAELTLVVPPLSGCKLASSLSSWRGGDTMPWKAYRVVALVIVVVCVGGGATSPRSDGAVQSRWVPTDLGTLGGKYGDSSEAVAINDHGQVVGNSYSVGGTPHAFLWEKGRMIDLGTLGGDVSSAAVTINDHGQVVGLSCRGQDASYSCYEFTEGRVRSFVWQNGHMTNLGSLGGRFAKHTVAMAANNRGEIVGTSPDPRSPFSPAFLWQSRRMLDLGSQVTPRAITDRGLILNETCYRGSGWCFWKKGRPHFGGARHGVAEAVNEAGEVVGQIWPLGHLQRPCLWQHGTVRALRLPSGTDRGDATDINERGQIVGETNRGGGNYHAVLWQDGRITDLGPLHHSATITINNYDQIVGARAPTKGAPQHAVLWTLQTRR